MAFAIRNLSVLAYANGFTLWHYRATAESLESIGAQGFFADAADMLCAGDIVMVSGQEGARILTVGAHEAQTAGRRAGPPRAGTVSLVPLA